MIGKNLDAVLFSLLIVTCSIMPNLVLGQGTLSGNGYYELYKIDSELNQVSVEYKKAESAISVNDAEKVYLERFAGALQDKRQGVCKKIENDLITEPACHQ